ncbi:unnamed protein product [Coffea canephora]|uniref:Enoyl reductase (ER) domain-containing protein n=1 Tax=Coffea canephora TaxID=49390 RepID=A0A068U089_COFCA|nr:unnamed protein product [Coffea canephora]
MLPLRIQSSLFGFFLRTYNLFFLACNHKRQTGEQDVKVKILYAGMCHSDLDGIKNLRGVSKYPFLPGHEIAGIVEEIGSKVTKFKVGNKIGYSDFIVVDEHFAVCWPENLPLDVGAPLLFAGITTYSPLKHFGLDKPGLHVGVVGLGGLGHVAVKIAKAFGAKVTVVCTSHAKRDEAIERLGADPFIISKDQDQLQAASGTLDGILDTASAIHPLLPLLSLLKFEGKLVLLGATKALELPKVLAGRKVVSGSGIGGMKEMQEMIDFCAKHNILPDVEVIPMDYVNTVGEIG